MRRLYLQIYATLLACLLVFALLLSLAWAREQRRPEQQRVLEGSAEIVGEWLPPADADPAAQERAAQRLAGALRARVTLRAPDGALLAHAGEALPLPRRAGSAWLRGPGPPGAALELPDGRWLLLRAEHGPHGAGLAVGLAILLAAVALAAYPLVRRLTRRLERLERGVERLGGGELGARVEVEGRDEVADLARSFNRAAERIERLVAAQRTVLASASHELRTPLARMSVALELLGEAARPELRQRMESDIAELDELIGELLLASRLETADGVAGQEVDLLGLAAEEAARVGLEARGHPTRVRGDPRLLRHLVRNLIENARRHAGHSPIELSVAPVEGGGARLEVADRGPGVPEGERERIFEPFYRPAGGSSAGVGLGLALVRRIARLHGGDAACHSREGGGARFEVLLGAPDSEP